MRKLAILLCAALGACSSGTAEAPRVLELRALNGSGVTGTVTLTAAGDSRTLVAVDADPVGHPDMPAHVHPGTCDDLVPQPMFPLENVIDGVSRTEIPISLAELRAEAVSVNLHQSNAQMEIFVACVEID